MFKNIQEWLQAQGEDLPEATAALLKLMDGLADLKRLELEDRVDIMFEALKRLAEEQPDQVEMEVICTMVDGILRGSGEVPSAGDGCS